MRIAIGIATRGRPAVLAGVLADLRRQTRAPDRIIVCHVTPDDVTGCTGAEFITALAGLPRQRNAILDHVLNDSSPTPVRPGSPRPSAGDAGTPPYAFGGFRRWLDPEGYPAIKPPWGTLNAVDLNTGALKWKVPLGEYKELTARGVPPTGTENYGGPVVTAGGLLFIGATADETIRAFHTGTGALLWQAPLPFSGNATPSTYSVDGRQFVVISAGGGKSGRPAGGTLVAFALPKP